MVSTTDEPLFDLYIGWRNMLKTRDSLCRWSLGELIALWCFTLRDHELIHHTSRCIDMFTHDRPSDIRCVFFNSYQRQC